MTYPKLKPCDRCQSSDDLEINKYEHGWVHVECVVCNYLGPGEGSILQAIRAHNSAATKPPSSPVPA